MDQKPNNPFNITKAVDFSDDEIMKYWVDISEQDGFRSLIQPTSAMPMLILGGKGSGKTHIMRYFSYSLQKIRLKDDFEIGLSREGYIGIYLRCGGLNSSRFQGKGQSEDVWRAAFAYNMELWLGQLVLETIGDILLSIPDAMRDEPTVCKEILNLFDQAIDSYPYSQISSVATLLARLQSGLDLAVNNSALTGKLEGLEILVSQGRLTFGIPKIIADNSAFFKNIRFVYLIDEFENLTEQQQRHINTLYREKEGPSTFKIGAKLYGIKTYKTFSAGEENKEGSEYEKRLLDKHFRDKQKQYDKFALSLCEKRLTEAGFSIDAEKQKSGHSSLNDYFELFEVKAFFKKISEKYKDNEKPYFKKLRQKLESGKNTGIDEIIENLRFPQDILIERTNIFLFYKRWLRNNIDLLTASKEIAVDVKKWQGGAAIEETQHKKVLDKFKEDIIAQIFVECGERLPYVGFDTFLGMSDGIPRNLLIILKQVFRWSDFNGEQPFRGGKISLESQYRGVQDAAEWFFEDARKPGRDGQFVKTAVNRLAQFLKEIRFSDATPECSLSSFSVNITELNPEAIHLVELSEKFSYLIKVAERRERNSKRIDPVYQINGMLAPKWELPIYRRGEILISKNEAESIFDPKSNDAFERALQERKARYNLPLKVKDQQNLSLFQQGS